MSVITERILFCNGGQECSGEPFGIDGNKQRSPQQLREDAKTEGWVVRGRKDFCPDCASRLELQQI